MCGSICCYLMKKSLPACSVVEVGKVLEYFFQRKLIAFSVTLREAFPMVLVANKVDLVHLRKVTTEQGHEMAAKHNVSIKPLHKLMSMCYTTFFLCMPLPLIKLQTFTFVRATNVRLGDLLSEFCPQI